MRFSTVAALCAAPLALAGSLEAEMVARGVNVEVRAADDTKATAEKAAANNGNTIIIQESTSITEVIVIWINNGGNAATQTVNTPAAAAAATAAAVTHTVVVGGTAGLVYSPDSISAAIGDMVVFSFESQNHTVTESAFTTPCEKLAGGVGFDSGFVANINNTISPPPAMALQVTVSTPLWFYCKQAGHCGKGMTFSINPTTNKTQADFKAAAIAQNGTALATAAIVSGAASKSSTVSVAAATTSASSGTMVAGTGTIQGGACSCSCLCGVAAFPNPATQGLAAFGGFSGAMPMSALEA